MSLNVPTSVATTILRAGARIAVSGATGLVGGALSISLKGNGYEVIPIVRSAKSDGKTKNAVIWDPLTGLTRPETMNDVDAVIHLAGRSIVEKRWNAVEKQRLRNSRVDATMLLCSQLAALPSPPKVFISASAVGIYGDCRDAVVSEETTAGKDFLAQLADDWEHASSALLQTECRVVHARFGIVLSKAGGALVPLLRLFKLGLGGRVGSGQQFMSWIALADTVRVLQWMLEGEAIGPYNVVATNAVKNAEFTRVLAETLRRPAFLPAPKFALKAIMGEAAGPLLLSSCRAEPKKLLNEGFEFRHADLATFLTTELRGSPSRSVVPSLETKKRSPLDSE